MYHRTLALTATIVAVLAVTAAQAGGRYFDVTYPPSEDPDGLEIGVTHTVWIPDGVKTLRGVIVHQHGCGTGACTGGETAAFDLHWQALARKWDCALLGPSYQQRDGQNCRLWCDPRNGSEQVFLRALDDLAAKSGHAELSAVPWCLWGHSGGAFWSSLMQTLHPDRVVAAWLRSGTAWHAWEQGEIVRPELTEAVYAIPTMLNPGVKERDDERFHVPWFGSISMLEAYRREGALIGFAPDPLTGHECGDSRYLAIPFFDVCLAARLPDPGIANQMLKPFDVSSSRLAVLHGHDAVPAAEFQGEIAKSVWLPDERFAKLWGEYVQTGAVGDETPPPAPTSVALGEGENGARVVTWEAEADFESGLRQFIILRGGQEIGRVPPEPVSKFGRPLFQGMSYHDTPNAPLAKVEFVAPIASSPQTYAVISVNSVGLQSNATPATVE